MACFLSNFWELKIRQFLVLTILISDIFFFCFDCVGEIVRQTVLELKNKSRLLK